MLFNRVGLFVLFIRKCYESCAALVSLVIFIFIFSSCAQPWQPHIFIKSLNVNVLCGDSFGEKLICCTENGTFLFDGVLLKATAALIILLLILLFCTCILLYNIYWYRVVEC